MADEGRFNSKKKQEPDGQLTQGSGGGRWGEEVEITPCVVSKPTKKAARKSTASGDTHLAHSQGLHHPQGRQAVPSRPGWPCPPHLPPLPASCFSCFFPAEAETNSHGRPTGQPRHGQPPALAALLSFFLMHWHSGDDNISAHMGLTAGRIQ